MEPSSAPALTVSGLGWSVGGHSILSDVDLTVARGESLVVIGPNGAGKTTLLRLLAGLAEPTAGSVAHHGDPISRLSRRELARRMAYVPQIRPARVPLTVETVVEHGRYAHLGPLKLVPGPADRAAVDAALAAGGVEALRHRPLSELSGGERQAVYIAAALAQEAPLLLLDEPTTHLDPGHQRDVGGLILALAAGQERTVVTATHDLHLAALVADRVVALAEGRVRFSGTPAEVLTPARLEELFCAPFERVRGGDRPVNLLSWERP